MMRRLPQLTQKSEMSTLKPKAPVDVADQDPRQSVIAKINAVMLLKEPHVDEVLWNQALAVNTKDTLTRLVQWMGGIGHALTLEQMADVFKIGDLDAKKEVLSWEQNPLDAKLLAHIFSAELEESLMQLALKRIDVPIANFPVDLILKVFPYSISRLLLQRQDYSPTRLQLGYIKNSYLLTYELIKYTEIVLPLEDLEDIGHRFSLGDEIKPYIEERIVKLLASSASNDTALTGKPPKI